jgi:hypothetical protein
MSNDASAAAWSKTQSIASLLVQGYDLKRLKSPPMDSRTDDSKGAEADIREWALLVGSAAEPRDPHPKWLIALDAIALFAAATVVFTAVFMNLNALTAPTKTATSSPAAKAAVGDMNSLPTKQGGYTTHLDAQTAVLSIDDLPDYRLVSSAEAVRPEGVVPNGWDNVFQKSHPGVIDYRMAEAIVVIYGTSDEAIAAADLIRQAEESQGAKASPALVGNQSTTWVEPLEIPGYEIVRVVLRTDNVVAQIAILGKDSPLLSDDVKRLASTQQTRLARLLQGNA